MFNQLYSYLNKIFRISFKDEEIENKFQKDYLSDSLPQNKFSMWMTLIIYLFYLPFSYFATPDDFYIDLLLMIFVPILSSIIFIFRVNTKSFKEYIPLNLFIYSILISIPPIISLSYTSKYHQIYLNNYTLVIVGVFIMFGAPFIVTFFSLFFVNAFMTYVLLSSNTEMSFILYNLFFVNTALAISAISAYFIERSKRQIYLSKYEQEDLMLQLKKQENLLKHQTRLAQMGEMISMIAHQWRQPLGAISSTVIGIQIKQETGRYNLDNKEDRDKLFENIEESLNPDGYFVGEFFSQNQLNFEKLILKVL